MPASLMKAIRSPAFAAATSSGAFRLSLCSWSETSGFPDMP